MKRLVFLGALFVLLLGSAKGQGTQNITMSNSSVTISCSASVHFYDPGGPNGDYSNNLDITQTIQAPEGQCLQVSFSSFVLESAYISYWDNIIYDYLEIYDGTTTTASLIGQYHGTNSPGVVVSTYGALTFKFHSDISVKKAGWSATISCVECSSPPPPPPPGPGCDPQSTANGSPCSMQTYAHAFCTGENPYGVTFPSGLSGEAEEFFTNSSSSWVSCLHSAPRPAWYYMQIDQPGDLLIYIQQFDNLGGDMDVDFACWGPFVAANQTDFMDQLCCGQITLQNNYSSTANVNGSFTGSHRPPNGNHNGDTGGYPVGNVVDCSWSASSTEWCYIPNAQPGQWYLLLITNYAGRAGTITFGLVESSSTATTNCSLLAPISYNNPLCEGDTLILTCENPIEGGTYIWSGPNGWSDTTQVPTVSIPDVTVDDSGQYSLQITGSDQDVNTSYVDVTITAIPIISISANHDTICSGSLLTLTATGAGTASQNYLWTPGNTNGRTKQVRPTTTVDTSYIYTVTGTYNGCSGTASDTIVVFPIPDVSVTSVPDNATICKGDTAVLYASGGESYEWRQNNQTSVLSLDDSLVVAPSANTTYRVIATSAAGCTKSVTKTVTVRPRPTVSISGADHVCLGDSVQLTAFPSGSSYSYLWNTEANTRSIWVAPTETSDYEVVVTNNYGCTASAVQQVVLFSAEIRVYQDTICWNESYQDENFNTHGILAPGSYSYNTVYQTVGSCDSLVTLELVVLPMTAVAEYDTACDAYLWRGNIYEQSGVYLDSLYDGNGCLQVDTLHLVVNGSVTSVDSVEACERYTWINGITYFESTQTPKDTLKTSQFCDSVISLHLTVYHAVPEALYQDTCSFYSWHGTVYNATGIYLYPTEDEHGCPRTDTLVLTIHHPSPAAMSAQSCDSYVWHDSTYYESGIYTYGHTDENGCWQVDTLYLSITPPEHLSETVTACESYVWHGVTNMQSGTYMYAHTDMNNCLQMDTLYLTVYHAAPVVEKVIVCEPYTWHGHLYDVSDTYLYAYVDEHNCPCVDTLRLTVTTRPELVLNTVMNATCNQANGEIKIDASGGTMPYRYVYMPEEEEAIFDGLAAGNYHLQMIDSIGCTDQVDFHIDNIIHQVNLVNVTAAHCGRADGEARIAASGGFGEFTYQWSPPIVSTTNIADHIPAGLHSVAVVDSDGCSLSLTFRVTDVPGPEACFAFSTSNEQQVTFINCTSQDVTSWFWSFGDGQTSTEWQPSHIYHSTGEYPVMLTVEDSNQCVDSLSLMYVIREVSTLYLPSAFIPESDIAENRVFKPYGTSISESSYEMTIFDRWGQMVFVSHHPDYGWDGRVNGQLAPQGQYVYQVTYQDLQGKPGMAYGSVLLLRGRIN